MAIVVALGVAALVIPRLGSGGGGGDQRAGVPLGELQAPAQQQPLASSPVATPESTEPDWKDTDGAAPTATSDPGVPARTTEPAPAHTDTSGAAQDDLLKDLVEAIKNPPPTLASTPAVAEDAAAAAALPASSAATSEPAAEPADPAAPGAAGKFKEIAPSVIRKEEDGSLMLDERFSLRGSGTKEDPYILNWDLLVSASETFQPRLSKMRIPERITMLDGKHVRITAYIAFPILAASSNEMLSMRNMWDGCCIGVPPTPYDAIEVRLKTAATGGDRFMSFGTVEGKFVVDPYVKGNWLLGLYMMEDATLTQTKEGGL